MSPALTLVLLWLAFGASHLALSSRRVRPALVKRLGDLGFLGLYSAVALLSFVPLVGVYFAHKHEGALLWAPGVGSWGLVVISGLMGVAFVLLAAGLFSPSLSSMTAGAGAADRPVTGVHLITRHGFFMALGIFGAVHLVPNGYATDVAFFGGFPVFVVLGALHQDARKLADPAARYRPYYEATPLFPFTGRKTLQGLLGLGWPTIVLGLGLAFLVRHYHADWFAG
ncbi:MAG: NnrU family protein [Myxococcota bacterium]|nr:NnrU family protein [Myxococcota bacterium]